MSCSHTYSVGDPEVEKKSVEGTIFKVIMDLKFFKGDENYQSTEFKSLANLKS